MSIDLFIDELRSVETDEQLVDFVRKHLIHGTPHVFQGREDDFYNFKRRMCDYLRVQHTEIFIVGSAKLGFSPHKRTSFSLDSDIDLAIVSERLFAEASSFAANVEYKLRSSSVFLRQNQFEKYHMFLRYLLIGWMRPDFLPHVEPCRDFRTSWFDFFESISNAKSEVGNYKVSAGVFRSHDDLERYSMESVAKVKKSLIVGEVK
ncbi:MAG: hypothetical protein K9G43_06970 [Rhodobacteraceae bacterium]|nr:hypothetical protein [Paracoccaceae bacterium]